MEYKSHWLVSGAILRQEEISLPWLRVFVALRLSVEFLQHRYDLGGEPFDRPLVLGASRVEKAIV